MRTLTLTDAQYVELLELVSASYRQLHREAWEIKASGGEGLEELRQRLETTSSLLRLLDSSIESAMRSVVGDFPLEEI